MINSTAPERVRSSTADAIVARDLRKSYGNHTVLDGIDLTVPTGSIFSLLGPNGAGKTTVVHILSTLINSDGGHAIVGGHDLADDPRAVRSVIGVTGQFAAVDELLNGRENLRLMTELRHLPPRRRGPVVDDLLERFDLIDAATKPVSTYSGGMRRRLDLAMTLIGDPKIIFLDEPTTGLDPRSRRGMWQIVGELVAGGTTIFLTTQYLDEADELADRIAVLDHGRLVAEGTPEQLKRMVPGGHLLLQLVDQDQQARAAATLTDATADTDALTVQVPSDASTRSIRGVLSELDHIGIEPESFTIHTPDLDDVFLALTGHQANIATPPTDDLVSNDPPANDHQKEAAR